MPYLAIEWKHIFTLKIQHNKAGLILGPYMYSLYKLSCIYFAAKLFEKF